MLQGHVGSTAISAGKYGTICTHVVPTSSLARLHSMGQRSSIVAQDLSMAGHVDERTVQLTSGCAASVDGHHHDIRMSKASDGYCMHTAQNAQGERFFQVTLWLSCG